METFSMNIISHTLSQHSEMIAPGVMGINFMKPEKPINTMSEVYRLVQEEEQNKVKSPTPGSCTSPPLWQPTKVPPTVPPKPKVTPPSVQPPAAPAPTMPVLKPVAPAAPKAPEGPSQGPCSDCGRVITGAFVNLSDRILHEDCFNCSTCGAALKNVGYHNINNKLYCDMHARLAARVIAGNAASPTSFSPSAAPVAPAPVAAPKSAPMAAPSLPTTPLPTTSLAPQPAVAPAPLPASNLYQSVPTPFGMTNLPHSPSSSGNLAFRSISPQPFKRISGEYHRVNAPSSPTPGSAPSAPAPAFTSGPLPFEMKPYLPPEQSRISLFTSGLSESQSQSSHEITQSTQVSQVVQKTTQVTRQVTEQMSQSSNSQYSVDYKQVVGGQHKTKFVWPPPKSPFEVEGSAPNSAPSQPYSPLVTQPAPVQSQQEVKNEAPPSIFSVPPLPTTFSAPQETAPPAPITTQIPVEVQEKPAPPPAPEPAPIPEPVPAPVVSAPMMAPPVVPPLPKSTGSFAPVLPPIVDLKPAATTPVQPGVPAGAGSKPAPKKGRGQLMQDQIPGRMAICGDCGDPIRGPFIIALNRTWCPDHFRCNNAHCQRALIDVGFVEEQGQLYCEACYEAYLAPLCNKCNVRIRGDCLNALDKQWHPECFICSYCNKPFGNNSFYLEDGLPYCEKDWNELFTTKCVGCGFPIEAGDRWVEALNNNYHSQCFKCSICQKNLEGQSFYAKGGKPFCKQHAR